MGVSDMSHSVRSLSPSDEKSLDATTGYETDSTAEEDPRWEAINAVSKPRTQATTPCQTKQQCFASSMPVANDLSNRVICVIGGVRARQALVAGQQQS